MTKQGTSEVMEENLNLFDVLKMLLRRWRLVAGFLLLGVIIPVLFVLLVTPRYTSETILKFNPSGFEINGQKGSVSADMLDRLISGELAAIESPEVLLEVIKSGGLMHDPELTEPGILSTLLGAIGINLDDALGTAGREQKILTGLRKRLVVTNPDRTNLISIKYESVDAAKAARIANQIARSFLARHLDGRLSETPLASKWLADRTGNLRNRWRESEDRAEKFRTDNQLSYVGDENLREKQVNRINEQLVLSGTKTEEARARVEQSRQLLKSKNYEQLATVLKSDVLTRLRDRLAAASQREASLGITLLPNHPQLKQVRAELASLRRDIDNEGKRALENLEIEFRTARDRENLIRGNFEKTIQGMQDSGSALVKLRELERTAATDRAIYEAFLNRSNETQEQKTGELANFQLIKEALPQITPSFPSPLRVLLGGIAGSLIAGLGLALVLETHRNTLLTASDVTTGLRAPLLGSLPLLGPGRDNGPDGHRNWEMAGAVKPGMAFSRGIAKLNARFGNTDGKTGYQMVAVTSAVAGEGKTLVAISLAREAAARGLKVLLIDVNWTRPRLHRVFQDDTPVRRDHDHTVSPVIHDHAAGIDILPVLQRGRTAMSHAMTQEFSDLLRSAQRNYDRIIVDCGSVLEDVGGQVFANEADMALLVVHWDKTNRDTASRAIERLQGWNAHNIGVVLNRVETPEATRSAGFQTAGNIADNAGPATPFPAE